MVEITPLRFEEGTAIAVTVRLPKTQLISVSTETGYIMCGALDVRLLDEQLASREIIAGRAVGVRSVDNLLDAPLERVTSAAARVGVREGMTGRDAIRTLLQRERQSAEWVAASQTQG